MRIFRLVGILVVLLLLAACGTEDDSTPPPTEIVLAKRIATLAPTQMPNTTDLTATAQAAPARPTRAPAQPTASPTPYVGVFLGKAEVDLLVQNAAPTLDALDLPTRAQPGDTPLLCAIPIDTVFGTTWAGQRNLQNRMGCPIQQSFGFNGSIQVFEDGAMYFNPDTGAMWAISPGQLGEVGEFWFVEQPPADLTPVAIDVPEGFQGPAGIFAAVWTTYPDIRQGMGFAITGEQTIGVNLQRMEGGTLFADVTVGQVFVLDVDGDVFGPY